MGERIDLADFGGERWVEQVPIGQPLALDQHAQRVGVTQEVEPLRLDFRFRRIPDCRITGTCRP